MKPTTLRKPTETAHGKVSHPRELLPKPAGSKAEEKIRPTAQSTQACHTQDKLRTRTNSAGKGKVAHDRGREASYGRSPRRNPEQGELLLEISIKAALLMTCEN